MNTRAAFGACVGACILIAATAHSGTDPLSLIRSLVAGAALGAIAVYDVYERRIPNRLVLPATAACTAITGLSSGIPIAAAVAAAVVVLTLAAIALAKPGALGMGDAKLALLIAVAFPSRAALAVILGLGGAGVVGIAVGRRRSQLVREARVALAPFLAAATVAVLL